MDFLFVWCRDVMMSCHDVTKPDLPISACRCARKLILFLFPWFFRSLSSKMLLLVDVLERFTWFSFFKKLFPWYFESLSLKMLLIFYLCDAVMSWRHVMTSLNLIYLSQLVDVLESWFFFCFHGFLGHWVQKCYWFFICVMSWRHDVMSWRH